MSNYRGNVFRQRIDGVVELHGHIAVRIHLMTGASDRHGSQNAQGQDCGKLSVHNKTFWLSGKANVFLENYI